MSEKNRIEKVIQHLEMTSGQFASEIGVQNSTLSHILNNRNNPSLEVLKKILSRFSEISADWLILGQGSMLRFEKHSKEPTLFDSINEINSLSDHLPGKSDEKNLPLPEGNRAEMLKNTSGSSENSILTQSPSINRTQNVSNSTHTAMMEENVPKSIRLPENYNSGYPDIKSERKVARVILYFTDNTFQEFESK
jgi:transcriptional regulator with XRE-family HTH domain